MAFSQNFPWRFVKRNFRRFWTISVEYEPDFRVDEQRSRARATSCGAVAREQRRHRQRGWKPLSRKDTQRGGDLAVVVEVGPTGRQLCDHTTCPLQDASADFDQPRTPGARYGRCNWCDDDCSGRRETAGSGRFAHRVGETATAPHHWRPEPPWAKANMLSINTLDASGGLRITGFMNNPGGRIVCSPRGSC